MADHFTQTGEVYRLFASGVELKKLTSFRFTDMFFSWRGVGVQGIQRVHPVVKVKLKLLLRKDKLNLYLTQDDTAKRDKQNVQEDFFDEIMMWNDYPDLHLSFDPACDEFVYGADIMRGSRNNDDEKIDLVIQGLTEKSLYLSLQCSRGTLFSGSVFRQLRLPFSFFRQKK